MKKIHLAPLAASLAFLSISAVAGEDWKSRVDAASTGDHRSENNIARNASERQ